MKGTSLPTDDILEDIRKQLKEANERLKSDAEHGKLPQEFEGDSVSLHDENQDEEEDLFEEEPLDEVVLEDRTPEKEEEEMQNNIEAVKQNLRTASGVSEEDEEEEEWNFLDEEEEEESSAQGVSSVVNDVSSSEPQEERMQFKDSASLSEAWHEKNYGVEEEDPFAEEDSSGSEAGTSSDFEANADDDLESNDFEEELEDDSEEDEEEFEDEEDYEEEPVEEVFRPSASFKSEPYYEQSSKVLEASSRTQSPQIEMPLQKIPNYKEHELSFEEPLISALSQKISDVLEHKFASLAQAQSSKKTTEINTGVHDDTKVKDLVVESLPLVLEKWIDKNQNLILNIVERVAERQISEAIAKIKDI